MLQVLRYLQAFAAAFQLHQYITFDTEVVKAVPLFPSHKDVQQPQQQQQQQSVSNGIVAGDNAEEGSPAALPWPQWQITTEPIQHNQQSNSRSAQHTTETHNGDLAADTAHANGLHSSDNGHSGNAQTGSDRQTDGQPQTRTYDALVVCNGHYSAPRCPEVSGSEAFPGTVMHSHNYRDSTAFRGQTVVLVGASASGEDICREIAEVADKVTAAVCLSAVTHQSAAIGAITHLAVQSQMARNCRG